VKKIASVALLVVLVIATASLVAIARHYHKKALASVSASATLVVGRSMFEYYTHYGCFPEAISNSTGYAHSWRTQIDNFQRERNRQETLDLFQPWNSKKNMFLAQFPESCFDQLSIGRRTNHVYPSSYFVVIGGETAFPPNGTTQLSDMTDGIQNTVLIIELAGSTTPWTHPGDVNFSELIAIYETRHELSLDVHARGNALIFADGERFYMERKLPFKAFQSLFTIAGQEAWTRAQLAKEGFLTPR